MVGLTDKTPLPTVDELATWMGVPKQAEVLAGQLRPVTETVKRAIRSCWTHSPVGVWLDTAGKQAALEPSDDPGDTTLVKWAVSRVVPVLDEPQDWGSGQWVKVAYSPFLRRAGEVLNFFPGTIAGISNMPSPVTSMLTSGLLGAGLGYGSGMLLERLMPDKWEKGKLRRTLAILGALPGPALSGTWMMANAKAGLPLNSPKLLDNPPGHFGDLRLQKQNEDEGWLSTRQAIRDYATKLGEQLEDRWNKMAGEAMGGGFVHREPSPTAVNVDTMGRVLWMGGASPQTSGMTMGALGAAQQLPGGVGPGWVTPGQMGQLAAQMGGGYLSGKMVGLALGLLTGMPDETQELLARTGMYAGIARALVPKLFGD